LAVPPVKFGMVSPI